MANRRLSNELNFTSFIIIVVIIFLEEPTAYSLTRQRFQANFGTNELRLIRGSARWLSICPSLPFWKAQFSLHLIDYFPAAILFSKTRSQNGLWAWPQLILFILKRAVGGFNNRFPARRRSIKGDWPGRKEVILVS